MNDHGPDHGVGLDVATPVGRFLRRVVGRDRAEDLASETMLTLLEYVGRRPIRRPVAFALRVAWNKAVDLIRRDAHRVERSDAAAVESARAPDRSRVAELREWLNSGLMRLSNDDRTLLRLRYEDDLSYRDLARRLDLPVGTVGRRLHEARRRLAEALREIDDGSGFPIVLAVLPALSRRATTLPEALGLVEVAGSPLAAGWWVFAMSKRVVAAVLLLVVGAGGMAWWLVRDGQPAAPPAAGPIPPPGENVARVAGPEPQPAPPLEPIEGRPFAGDEPDAAVSPVLTGRVVDMKGSPVPGARVHVANRGSAGGFDIDGASADRSRRATTFAGPDGTFEADVHGLGCAFDVTATAAGFAPGIVEEVALSGPPIEIRLGRGVAVSGTVRELRGSPVAGASVTFRALAGRGRIRIGTATDAAGRFSLECLPDPSTVTLGVSSSAGGPVMGEAHLLVEAEGYAPQRVGVLDPRTGTVADSIDVHLARGGIFEGVVRAQDGGLPIADAEVVLWTLEGMQGTRNDHGVIHRNPFGSRIVARTRSDAAGRYRFDHVPAPIGGIRLLSSAMTTTAGMRARLGGIAAYREGYAPGGVDIGAPNAEREVQTADITLAAAVVVTGRVLDRTGRPIAGARVFCVERDAGAAGPHPGMSVQRRLVAGESGVLGGSVLSGDDGTFRHVTAPATPGATVLVYACGCDLGLPSSERKVVSVDAGAAAEVGDLVIERLASRVVAGEIRDERGGPVAGARIEWRPDETRGVQGASLKPPPPAYSDHRGEFEARIPSEGAGRMAISARGRVTRHVDAPPGDGRLSVTLQSGALLSGAVVRSDGAAVMGAVVRAVPGDLDRGNAKELRSAPAFSETRSGPGGTFTLDGPSERVLIVAYVIGEGTALAVEGPLAAPARDVAVTLPAREVPGGKTVEVRVVDDATSERWVAAVRATLSAATDAFPKALLSGNVDAPGTIRFRGVAPGTYDLAVECPGHAVSRVRGVHVDEESVPGPIEVRLGGGSGIDGNVVLPYSAKSLDGVEITASNEAGSTARTRTSADGTFRLRSLAPGRWVITGSCLGGTERSAAAPVAVDVGPAPVRVTVALVPAVETRVSVTVTSHGKPIDAREVLVRISLVDRAGHELGSALPQFSRGSVLPASIWTAPGEVKAVARQGARVLGSAEGKAGGEIALTVSVD